MNESLCKHRLRRCSQWEQNYSLEISNVRMTKTLGTLWTVVGRSNHPAFLQGNKALTMTLLSFCFTWLQGFEHTTEMLPVYQHLSPGRPLSLSREGTGSSSNSISEAPAGCWGKQACLCADTFPSAHSLFWVAAKKPASKGRIISVWHGAAKPFLEQLSSSSPHSASLTAE